MSWTEVLPSIAVLGVVVTMWWQLSSRIDALNKLLTENLLEMKGELGEVKGELRAHTH